VGGLQQFNNVSLGPARVDADELRRRAERLQYKLKGFNLYICRWLAFTGEVESHFSNERRLRQQGSESLAFADVLLGEQWMQAKRKPDTTPLNHIRTASLIG
jgi:hypothetical protein